MTAEWKKPVPLKKAILSRLNGVERDHNVKILYACESGSRAWGFESADSDWDARFIYIRPKDWYLSIDLENRRDVIELPEKNNLDITGWDVRKALRLFQKSNPPLMEWLDSPLVYIEVQDFIEGMRELKKRYYSLKSARLHYLHMARGNYREYLKGDVVWLKKYFYVLRPILATIWIDEKHTPVPTPFLPLVEELLDSGLLKEEIHKLLEAKKAGNELDSGPNIPVISRFIEEELAKREATQSPPPSANGSTEELNRFFLQLLSLRSVQPPGAQFCHGES